MEMRTGRLLAACALALGCVLAWSVEGASALRVLGVIPFASKSHHAVLHALLTGLADRGHSVVSLEFFAPNPLPNNYTSVPFDPSMLKRFEGQINPFDLGDMPYMARTAFLWHMGTAVTEELLQHPEVQAVAKGERGRFDVLVVEAFFNEAFLGLAHIFDIPIVQVCPYVGSSWMYGAVSSPSSPAYVPDPFLPFSDHMTFNQRLWNFLFVVYQEVGRIVYYLPKQENVMQRWLNKGRSVLPSIRDLHSSTALMLVNSHIAISYPRPLTPNLVAVAGMHVRPTQALPQDLNKILSNCKNGVIYFSMGSALQSSKLPQDKVAAILDAFRSLKETVIWKWETDSLPGKPDNVIIRKWLPQNDLLAHPNIKVFITHGGLLSSIEALHHGVPLIGIPVFGDQQLNMERAVMAGYAIQIQYEDLSANSLRSALNEMLSNKSYRENAKRLSQVFQDQQEPPLERAIWWVEYIVRHKGASHLHSAAKNLTWYQYYLLDVVFFIFGGLLIVTIIAIWIILFICRNISSKKNKELSKDSTKKRK